MTVDDPGDRIVERVARFARRLHDAGLEVGPNRIQDALLATTAVDIGAREEVYWAWRCTLVSREEDLALFDRAFAKFGAGEGPSGELTLPPGYAKLAASTAPNTVGRRERHEPAEPGERSDEAEVVGMRASPVELLRDADFARYTDEDLEHASRLVEEMAKRLPMRRSRRVRTAKSGAVFDTRRTLRYAMRTDGYPVARLWREPRLVPRRLLFVVDVSGSMQPYARAMLMFMQAAVHAGRRVEAFTFGTRLTRVTPELRRRDWNRALEAATRNITDWAGGTRIGESLKKLLDEWGPKRVIAGAVVVILSDGWECGDVDGLAGEMVRLHRAAYMTVWVNPLAGRPGYQPLTAGMAAALPSIDRFLPGHNLHSFDALADLLHGLPDARHGRSVLAAHARAELDSRSR